jgi:molybdopterin molybdotransferase
MGDYDIVKEILAEEGEINFWQVRMKPGKPLAFGQIGGVPHLGLPGNPVSSMVSFEIFARPALYKMLGRTNLAPHRVQATLEEAVGNRDGRRVFTRVVLSGTDGDYRASLTGPQGSGVLTSMIRGNGLAVIPEERDRVAAGEQVEVILLDRDD